MAANTPNSANSKLAASSNTTKLVKVNGFFMFMEARRQAVLAAGYKLRRGRAELSQLLSDEWEATTQEEKERYKTLANEHNIRARLERGLPPEAPPPPPQTPKLSASQKALMVEADLSKSAHEAVDAMFRSIDNMLAQRIVICSFTRYYEGTKKLKYYIPAEIGLTAMSIEKGVTDSFGRIIDPGEDISPSVLSITYKRLSIPELGSVRDFQELNKLVTTVEDFVDLNEDLSSAVGGLPVFVLDSDIKTVSKCFEWLFAKTGKSFILKLASLNRYGYLASRQQPSCGSGGVSVRTSLRPAHIPLTHDFAYPHYLPGLNSGVVGNEEQIEDLLKGLENFRHMSELSCLYHQKRGEGIYNCPLVATNRYAFSLLELLTWSNQVEIQPGRHHPDVNNPRAEARRRQQMLREWGTTQYEETMERATGLL